MLIAKTVTIEREGEQKLIAIPDNFIEKLISNEKSMLFYPRIPAIISSFIENSNCEKAGFKTKDQILSINGVEVKYNDERNSFSWR